jgi:hypothetical protein
VSTSTAEKISGAEENITPAFSPAAVQHGGQDSPIKIELSHALFRKYPGYFKLSEVDDSPVYVTDLGPQTAILPTSSIKKEFKIDAEHPDFAVLQRIDTGVEFLDHLGIGDALPAEVLTGEASWQASAHFLHNAADNLRAHLALWGTMTRAGKQIGPKDYSEVRKRLGEPHVQKAIWDAHHNAAETIGLEAGDRKGVAQRIDELAANLAYIESLRESFNKAGRVLGNQVEKAANSKTLGSDQNAREAARGLVRLQTHSMNVIGGRFSEIDLRTSDILGFLKDPEAAKKWIATRRNDLYRESRKMLPLAAKWQAATPGGDNATRDLLLDTYRSLARRYLPAHEWSRVIDGVQSKLKDNGKKRNTMNWM